MKRVMRGWMGLAAVMVLMCAPQGQVWAQDGVVASKDIAPPSSNDYGVEENKLLDKPDFSGLNAEQFAALLKQFPALFHTQVLKDVWAQWLLAPLSGAESGVVPKDWAATRFQFLRKMGELPRLDALLASVPEALANDWILQERVRRLVANAKGDEGCAQVQKAVDAKPDGQAIDGFWLMLQSACLRKAGKIDQAEIALSLMGEMDAQMVTPLAYALVEDEKSTKPLPALSAADGRTGEVLLLLGLLDESRRDGLLARVGAGFVDGVNISSMSAELARELANASALASEKRVLLAEQALIKGVSPAAVLRSLYNSLAIKAESGKLSDSPALKRAKQFAAVAGAVDAKQKAEMLYQVYPDFSGALGVVKAGELFEDELGVVRASPLVASFAPSPLAWRMAFHYLAHFKRPDAKALLTAYESAESPSDGVKATTAILAQALALHDAAAENEADVDTVDVASLKNLAPSEVWALSRMSVVMKALGYNVGALDAGVVASVPKPKVRTLEPALQAQLSAATTTHNKALLVATALEVLRGGQMGALSDDALAQVLSALKQEGYTKLAYFMARDALLLSPRL